MGCTVWVSADGNKHLALYSGSICKPSFSPLSVIMYTVCHLLHTDKTRRMGLRLCSVLFLSLMWCCTVKWSENKIRLRFPLWTKPAPLMSFKATADSDDDNDAQDRWQNQWNETLKKKHTTSKTSAPTIFQLSFYKDALSNVRYRLLNGKKTHFYF